MTRKTVTTDQAPAAIGAYSQAVTTTGTRTTYISGQIPLHPGNMEMVSEDFAEQTHQVFSNLCAVATAAGGSPDNIVKLTVYLQDLSTFASLNEIMAGYFNEPYPARAAVEVAALPRGALIEIDAIMCHE